MTQPSLTLTSERIRQITEAIHSFAQIKMDALRAIPGNPYGIESRQFGNAIAHVARAIDDTTLFNMAANISEDDAYLVDDILAWYSMHQTECSFNMVLQSGQHELRKKLASKGYYQSDSYNLLYGKPVPTEITFPDLEIRSVRPDEGDLFANIYMESFGNVKTDATLCLYESIKVLVGQPSMQCFFTCVETRPVAIGVLHNHQNVGYFALGATLPNYRGKYIQSALIQKGIDLSNKQSCEYIAAQADFPSVSHLNLEKMGFRVGLTKVIWKQFQRKTRTESI